ncbi:amidohydrolase family protein [Salmonirosea aquatica]
MKCIRLFTLLLISIQAFSQKYAIEKVSIIPMDQGITLENQTLLMENGKIIEIGSAAQITIPNGFQIIDGKGKFLMPGLSDMHAHFFNEQGEYKNTIEAELKVMLANGLTMVRIMAGHPNYLQARQSVREKRWLGPDLVVASPQLVGRWPWDTTFRNYAVVDTPAKAEDAVRRFKKEGYDAIKITFMVDRPAFDAINKTAKEVGIKVVGHVGPKVKLPVALAAGEQIDHMDEFIDTLLPDTSYNHGESVSDMNLWRMNAWNTVPYLDESKIPALSQMVKKSGIYVCPTNYFFISCFGASFTEDHYRSKPDFGYIPQAILPERWRVMQLQRKMPIPPESIEKYVAIRKKLTKSLWEAEVPLMAGSDSPEWFLMTGFSIHDELRTFVDAGLSPFAALQTATVHPADYLGLPQKGRIKKGMDADLVLLNQNPLENIDHTKMIAGVFKNGQWFSRTALDEFLSESKKVLE